MIEFAREFFDIDKFLPKMKIGSITDWTWIYNLKSNMLFYLQLVHSQIPLKFEDYIDRQLAERKEKYIKK